MHFTLPRILSLGAAERAGQSPKVRQLSLGSCVRGSATLFDRYMECFRKQNTKCRLLTSLGVG